VFDATLGFPGEGPLIVATYNINGTRESLAAVLAQAKLARIDILLLQELFTIMENILGSAP
jgi:exonuclease III